MIKSHFTLSGEEGFVIRFTKYKGRIKICFTRRRLGDNVYQCPKMKLIVVSPVSKNNKGTALPCWLSATKVYEINSNQLSYKISF